MAADTGAPVLVVAGPGNNGGDAWVAAAHLREAFHRVIVLDFAGTPPKAPEAREARDRFVAAGGATVRDWPADIRPALVVDGLLGIGLARDVDGAMAALVQRINACGAPVLSIDIPSGIASDTGAVRGVAVRATRTITFIARKVGLHTGDALDHTGEIVVDGLGLDPALLADCPGSLLTADSLRGMLAPRARNSHKGSFGTLGVVGGGKGMTGAAILAARAGLLAGAGKVYVGLLAPEPPAFDPVHPELMLRSVDDTLAADVLVVGPGAGHSPDRDVALRLRAAHASGAAVAAQAAGARRRRAQRDRGPRRDARRPGRTTAAGPRSSRRIPPRRRGSCTPPRRWCRPTASRPPGRSRRSSARKWCSRAPAASARARTAPGP